MLGFLVFLREEEEEGEGEGEMVGGGMMGVDGLVGE